MKNWDEVKQLERFMRYIQVYTPKLKRTKWRPYDGKRIEKMLSKVDDLIEEMNVFQQETGSIEAQYMKELVIYMRENFRWEK